MDVYNEPWNLEQVELVFIGPEIPLVEGLADYLNQNNNFAFGPSKIASQLEGSKSYTKDLCKKFNIPTAKYEKFTNKTNASEYIENHPYPLVIKVDGLAAGKGVIIAENKSDALSSLNDIYIYGDTNINNCPRAGTIAFNILGMDHGLVAAILNDYYNIAVRNECFCAHPYVQQMLQKTHEKELNECEFKDNHLSWKLESWMGMVRVSFGIYNDYNDVDALVIALSNIVKNKEEFFNFYKLNDSGD